jgi:hypothetical protein
LVNLSKVLQHETLLAIFTNKSTPAEISLHIKMDASDTNLLAGVHCFIRLYFTEYTAVVLYPVTGWPNRCMDPVFSGEGTQDLVLSLYVFAPAHHLGTFTC